MIGQFEVKSFRIPIGEETAKWAEKRNIAYNYYKQCASTNDIAKQDRSYQLYVADHQTQGRGQYQRTWKDQQEGQLLSSWAFSVRQVPQPEFSLSVGKILGKALLKVWPELPVHVKEPNDIYLLQDSRFDSSDEIIGKKVAGLLIESISQGDQHRLIIGLGLNVWNHPSTEVIHSTSLENHLHTPLTIQSWEIFLDAWMNFLSEAVHPLDEIDQ